MDIQNKVVIITGASEGIGEATAKLFATHGARVVLAARSADKLNAVRDAITAAGGTAIAIPTDMRDQTAIRALVEAAHTHFGQVDMLINNAGQAIYAPIEHIKVAQYQQIIELNLFGVLHAMQAVIPIMRAQGGGVIINISSNVSKMAIPNIGAYASTKYALNGLTLTARAELAADNIRVCLMHPGLTATEFGKNAMVSHPDGRPDVSPSSGTGAPPPDSVEMVAAKILEAAQNEPVEQFMR
ncbi:MAG: SDR family oxidoreductase [Chloroflexota bacterium]